MSFRNFLKSHPPLVVFVISLLAFAVTTLGIGMAVKSRNPDEIQNPDSFDWYTFFHKMSELELCLGLSNEETLSNETTMTTVSWSVPVSKVFAGRLNDVTLTGLVKLDHMDRGRLGKYKGMVVKVTMDKGQENRSVNDLKSFVFILLIMFKL